MKRSPGLLLPLLLAVLLAAPGCRSGRIREDPILRLSAAEALAKGKEMMAKEKYAKAVPYLNHAFEVEPNSVTGREALLLAADALYLQGGDDNYIKAEAKYRDFQNRFPTSDRAPYVQFQIAASLAKRMEKPDRDQSATRKAEEAYEDLLRLFPQSEYAEQAREQLRLVRDNLAEHEFLVGRFYLRFGMAAAAAMRFEYLLAHYPRYSEIDKAVYHLGIAYERSGKPESSAAAFERLRSEFPDSPYAARASLDRRRSHAEDRQPAGVDPADGGL